MQDYAAAIDIKEDGDYVILDFHGAGFLQNMVRILTGTLVEVGAGRMEPAYMMGEAPQASTMLA